MPVGEIEEALSQLDVGERALLDLSVHRGFDDERIASLLGVEVAEVGALRRAALEKLFRLRAVSGDGARDAVRAELRTVSDSTWIDPPAPQPRGRRSPNLLAIAAILALAAAIVTVALLTGGDSESDSGAPSAGSTTPTQPTEPAKQTTAQPAQPGGVALEPLSSGTPGKVTASARGSGRAQRLTLKLRGLAAPDGAYELWLYDSLVHARPLGSVTDGNGSISSRLPADASSYSWLDLTLQPGSDRVHHSGESIFRTRLDRVLGSSR